MNVLKNKTPYDSYESWSRHEAYQGFLIYTVLVIIFHTSFGHILKMVAPNVDDSFTNRIITSCFHLLSLIAVVKFQGLKKYIHWVVSFNVIALYISVHLLVVHSANHPMYLASSLLAIYGVQLILYDKKSLLGIYILSYLSFLIMTFFFDYETNIYFSIVFYTAVYIIVLAMGYFRMKSNEREYSLLSKLYVALENLEKEKSLSLHNARMTYLGDMASGMAHEINNPLTVVSFRLETLAKLLQQDPLPLDSIESTIEIMREKTMQISKVINQVRAFAKESGKEEIEEVSLKSIMDSACGTIKPLCEKEGVDFFIDAMPEIKLELRPIQTYQAISNVLLNAFEASVQREKKWIKVWFGSHERAVVIHIEDSGSGIEPEHGQDIFKPFYTTKEVGEGTGLGLSFAKGVIEGLGGSISLVEGKPHAHFSITIPTKSIHDLIPQEDHL